MIPAKKPAQRIALILSALLFANNTVLASLAEGQLWADRRAQHEAAERKQWARLPIPALPLPNVRPGSALGATSRFVRRPAQPLQPHEAVINSLPFAFGTVRSISRPSGVSNGIVVHIHDIHRNVEAQRNISEALRHLFKNEPIGLVALEGAFAPAAGTGRIDVDPIRRFPDTLLIRDMADYLLEEKKISGPIHTSLTEERSPPAIGIDDAIHHTLNVKAYQAAATQMPDAEKILTTLTDRFEGVKQRSVSVELRKLDDLASRYHRGLIDLSAYVKAFKETDLARFHHLSLFVEAAHLEKTLNFGDVERERAHLLARLSARLTRSEIDDLFSASLDLRHNKLSTSDFYSFLQSLCRQHGAHLSGYPTLNRYVQYVLMSDAIDTDILFDEVAALEDLTISALAKSPLELGTMAFSKRLHLSRKLLTFSLNSNEWTAYQKLTTGPVYLPRPNMDALARALAPFERFYDHARERDASMSRNLLRQLTEPKTKSAVLVTGGFHAKHMTAALNRAGYTVASYVPRVTKVSETDDALSVFTQEKSPLEKIFDGDKLFLAGTPISPAVLQTEIPAIVKAGVEARNPGPLTASDLQILEDLKPASHVTVETADAGPQVATARIVGAGGTIQLRVGLKPFSVTSMTLLSWGDRARRWVSSVQIGSAFSLLARKNLDGTVDERNVLVKAPLIESAKFLTALIGLYAPAAYLIPNTLVPDFALILPISLFLSIVFAYAHGTDAVVREDSHTSVSTTRYSAAKLVTAPMTRDLLDRLFAGSMIFNWLPSLLLIGVVDASANLTTLESVLFVSASTVGVWILSAVLHQRWTIFSLNNRGPAGSISETGTHMTASQIFESFAYELFTYGEHLKLARVHALNKKADQARVELRKANQAVTEVRARLPQLNGFKTLHLYLDSPDLADVHLADSALKAGDNLLLLTVRDTKVPETIEALFKLGSKHPGWMNNESGDHAALFEQERANILEKSRAAQEAVLGHLAQGEAPLAVFEKIRTPLLEYAALIQKAQALLAPNEKADVLPTLEAAESLANEITKIVVAGRPHPANSDAYLQYESLSHYSGNQWGLGSAANWRELIGEKPIETRAMILESRIPRNIHVISSLVSTNPGWLTDADRARHDETLASAIASRVATARRNAVSYSQVMIPLLERFVVHFRNAQKAAHANQLQKIREALRLAWMEAKNLRQTLAARKLNFEYDADFWAAMKHVERLVTEAAEIELSKVPLDAPETTHFPLIEGLKVQTTADTIDALLKKEREMPGWLFDGSKSWDQLVEETAPTIPPSGTSQSKRILLFLLGSAVTASAQTSGAPDLALPTSTSIKWAIYAGAALAIGIAIYYWHSHRGRHDIRLLRNARLWLLKRLHRHSTMSHVWYDRGSPSESIHVAAIRELKRLERFRDQVRNVIDEGETAAPLRKTVIISDEHGTIDKFDALIIDALRSVFPDSIREEFILNPDVPLRQQLDAVGLSPGEIKERIYFQNLGDLMDRGTYGIKVYRRARQLIELDLSDFIIGNHDLWMFMSLYGIHLPSYSGFNFHGYRDDYDRHHGRIDHLVAQHHEDQPETKRQSWWTERFHVITQQHDELQRNHWRALDIRIGGEYIPDAKGRDKERVLGTGLYAQVSASLGQNKKHHEIWNKLRGDFFDTLVFSGTRAVSKMSRQWWLDLLGDFQTAYAEIKRSPDFDETAPLPSHLAWAEAIRIIENDILPKVTSDLEDRLTKGEWWARAYEAIMFKNYTSSEWWAFDWISHDGWGTSVTKERNKELKSANSDATELTPGNFIDDPQLQEIAQFVKENFNLFRRDEYQNTYLHAFLPIDEKTGEFCIQYKGQTYRGKGVGNTPSVWVGLQQIAWDVQFARNLPEMNEALQLVNSWYADATTKSKAEHVAWAVNYFGTDELARVNGFNRLFMGHIPLQDFKKLSPEKIGVIRGFHIQGQGNGRVFLTDHGMGERFGARGGAVHVTGNGIWLRGFERSTSQKIIDDPRTIAPSKAPALEGVELFKNEPLPKERFLPNLLENIEARIKELEPAAGTLTMPNVMTPHIRHRAHTVFWKPLIELNETIPALFSKRLRDTFISRHPQFRESDNQIRTLGFKQIRISTFFGFFAGTAMMIVVLTINILTQQAGWWTWTWPLLSPLAFSLVSHYAAHARFNYLNPETPLALIKRAGNISSKELNHQLALSNFYFKSLLSLNIRMLVLESQIIKNAISGDAEKKNKQRLIRELVKVRNSLSLSLGKSTALSVTEFRSRRQLLVRLDEIIQLAPASFQAAAWALNTVALTSGQHYVETFEQKLNRASNYREKHRKVEFIRATGFYALLQSKYRYFRIFGHNVPIRTFVRKHFSTLWEAYQDLDEQIEDELKYKGEIERVLAMLEPVSATLDEAIEQENVKLPESLKDALVENLQTAFSSLHPHWVSTKELAHLGIRASQLQLQIGDMTSAAHSLRLAIRLLLERKREVGNILYNLERSRLAEVRDVTLQRNQEFLNRIEKKDFKWLLNRPATRNEPDFRNLASTLEAAQTATGDLQDMLLNDARHILMVSNSLFGFVKDYRIAYTRLRTHAMAHDEAQTLAFSTAYEQFLKKRETDGQKIDRNSALGRWWRAKFYTNVFVSPFLKSTKQVATPIKNQTYAALETFTDILQINEISKILASPVLNLEANAPRATEVLKSVAHKKTHVKSVEGAPRFLNTTQYDDLLKALAEDFSNPTQRIFASAFKQAESFFTPPIAPIETWVVEAPEGLLRVVTSVEELDNACRAAHAAGRVVTLMDPFDDLKRGAAAVISVFPKEMKPSPIHPLIASVKTLFERQMRAGHVSNGEWIPAIKIKEEGGSVFYATYRASRRLPDLHVGGLSWADQMESEMIAFLNTGRTTAPAKTEGVDLAAIDPEDEERRRLEPGRFENHNPAAMWILWQGSAHIKSNNPWRLFPNHYPTWPPRIHRNFNEQPLQMVAARGDGPVTQTTQAAVENVEDALHLQWELNRPLLLPYNPIPWRLATSISKVLMETLEEQHPFNYSVSPMNRPQVPQFALAVNSFPGGGASQSHAHLNLVRSVLPARHFQYGIPSEHRFDPPAVNDGVNIGIQDSKGRSIVMEADGLKANLTLRLHMPSQPGIGDGFDLYNFSVNLTDLLKFAFLSPEQGQIWERLPDNVRKLWVFDQLTRRTFHIRPDLFADLFGIVERSTLPTPTLLQILRRAHLIPPETKRTSGALGWPNIILLALFSLSMVWIEPSWGHTSALLGYSALLVGWHEGGHWLGKSIRDRLFSWGDYPRFVFKGAERGLIVPGSKGRDGIIASLIPMAFLGALMAWSPSIFLLELFVVNMIILLSTRDWADISNYSNEEDVLADKVVEASRKSGGVQVVLPLKDRYDLDGKSSVLLIKPSAGSPVHSTVRSILQRIRKNGYEINGVRVYDGTHIAENGMMQRQYGPHYQGAQVGLAYKPAEIKAGIDRVYKDSKLNTSRVRVLGALEAERLGIPRSVISQKWLEADAAPADSPFGNKKLLSGVRSALMRFSYADGVPTDFVGEPIIILNGFYPLMAAEFEKPGNKTIAVSLRPAKRHPTEWSVMRSHFAGDTNPEKAVAGSVRNDALKGILKVRVRPVNLSNNLIHLTENQGQESVDEHSNWFSREWEHGDTLAQVPGITQSLSKPVPLGLAAPTIDSPEKRRPFFQRAWDLRLVVLGGRSLQAALRIPRFATGRLDVVIVGEAMSPRIDELLKSLHRRRPTVLVATTSDLAERIESRGKRPNVTVISAQDGGFLSGETVILRELETYLLFRKLVTRHRAVNVVFDQNVSALDFNGLASDSIFRDRGTVFLLIDSLLRVLSAVPAPGIEALMQSERAAAIAA